jgi:hypothetical protein
MNSKLCQCSDYHSSCIGLVTGKNKKLNKIGKFFRHLKYTLRVYPLVHLIPIIFGKLRDLKEKEK